MTNPTDNSELLKQVLLNLRNVYNIEKILNLYKLDRTFQENPQELKKMLIAMCGPSQGELASEIFDRIVK